MEPRKSSMRIRSKVPTPSHKPLFKRAPEARPYSLKTSITFTMPYEFVTIQVLSSAYCEIFTSRPAGMRKPLISGLFRIATTSTNSREDKGHSCHTPFSTCKDGKTYPLDNMALRMFVYIHLIMDRNLGPKFILSKTRSKKSQST